MKTDYTVIVERRGADSYTEELNGFPTHKEAEAFCRNLKEEGTLIDRLLTSCTVHKNTHTSNPWRT